MTGGVMVDVLYSEYDATHRGDFKFDIPEGLDSWLLVMTQTPAIFLVGDRYQECPPNTVLLYKPHQRIFYKSNDNRFTNDWIMFYSDELFVTETSLPAGVPMSINDSSYLHNLFRLVAIEHELAGDYRESIVRKLIQIIFFKLMESNKPGDQQGIIRDINDLRREILAKPDLNWNVSMMAEKLSISTGYLETSYKAAFGISCVDEVIRSRVELAKSYLATTSLRVSEIVSLCGYRSPEHFFRQFKKMTGLTPRQYRISKSTTGNVIDDVE